MNWQLIETAPKDGTRVDLWAKTWRPHYDDFIFRRFTDCYWHEKELMSNLDSHWVNLDKDWHATHWMPIPEEPK